MLAGEKKGYLFPIFGLLLYYNSCSFFSLLQKKSKDHFGLEGDEESTMLEDSVSPKKYEGSWTDPVPWE